MIEPAVDYWSTHEGQFVAGAHRYLSAARLLTDTEEWTSRPSFLQTPVLHLLCHGVELLLKFPMLRAGKSPEVVRKFGHDLASLWESDANATLRREIVNEGRVCWQEAQISGKWPSDDFRVDPLTVIEKAVADLAYLHNRGSGFALRYSFEGTLFAPRPRFLIEAFGEVAERCVMNPGCLDS